jgi:GH15 family glucan-1,4-alpha-glucosidase
MDAVPRLDHGAIGNGRLLALVSPSTGIDWLCMPRFDSPSVFAGILDPEKGGAFRFEMEGIGTRMEYVANTNVLRTRVSGRGGAFDLFDFAPRIPSGGGMEAPLEVHRLLVPVEGVPEVRVRFDPRPDYGRARTELLPAGEGIEVQGGPHRLSLRTNVPAPYVLNGHPFRLDRPRYFVLSCGRPAPIGSRHDVQRSLDATVDGWRAWAKTCALAAFAPREVLRSALCLKLHAFTETGAIIAAATTSIPEAVGTQRTWDYRYCWLRDSAFVVEALRRLSHLAEGEAFVRFLRDVAEGGPLQPVYGIGGERNLPEEHLDHLAGFAGARPVRIGNAAHAHVQNDLMGEMVICLESLLLDPRIVPEDPDGLVRLVRRLVEEAIAASATQDTGIWEYRTAMRHHTFSRVLCWAAADRGARIARHAGDAASADRWSAWAEGERATILARAYSDRLGCFTQGLDGENPDASNLLLPALGFLGARDPRFVSTVRRYEEALVEGGLMLRYRHPDDLGATTSAFTICSFWWAEALAMMGEVDRAAEVFQRILGFANPLGLFSEDIDPATGRALGNFPQAYTHVGLVHAATTIGEVLEAREGRFRA